MSDAPFIDTNLPSFILVASSSVVVHQFFQNLSWFSSNVFFRKESEWLVRIVTLSKTQSPAVKSKSGKRHTLPDSPVRMTSIKYITWKYVNTYLIVGSVGIRKCTLQHYSIVLIFLQFVGGTRRVDEEYTCATPFVRRTRINAMQADACADIPINLFNLLVK